MASQGQYQGSQAFSHMVPGDHESVNPNTASLNYTAPLLNLRGVRSSVDVNLSIIYSHGTLGTFGLPPTWSLNLPYVTDGKSVTTREGRTYVIDREWSDTTKYKSGLRYMNNHGVKFEKVEPPLKLPSGRHGSYGYRLDQADGSHDYFDIRGKPVEYHDIYGNSIYYVYVGDFDVDVHHRLAKLDHVQDSWGQVVQFKYAEGQRIDMILPDGTTKTSVAFSQDGIKTITDPAGLKTTFDYVPFTHDTKSKVLSSIRYPTGLVSRYEYTGAEYVGPNGKSGYKPAVRKLQHLDPQGNRYSHTEYRLGSQSSGSTYTGARIGVKMGGTQDLLVEGNSPQVLSFKYDVTQTSHDEQGRITGQITTWFNNYHLPIEQTRHKLGNEQGGRKPVPAYKTAYEYDIPHNVRARTPAYHYPSKTEVFHAVGGGGDSSISWKPLTRCSASYNEFGNLRGSTEELHVSGAYRKQATTETDYTTTSRNVQIPKTSTRTDHVAQTVEQTVSTVTPDGRNVASVATAFSDQGTTSSLKPWTQRVLTYDDQGRTSAEERSWAPGAPVPEGSLSSVKNRMTFSFDKSTGTLTQEGHDAKGNVTTITSDVRKQNGPLLARKLPRGQTETFKYDDNGRLTQHVDALDHVTVTDYTVGPVGGTETTTSPRGYVKRTCVDVLGRVVQTQDNGDPTQAQASREPTRVLGTTKYDFSSRVAASTNRLGLTAQFTFDALDRPLTVTDPNDNVIHHEYDDANLTVTQTINGDVRIVTQLDGRLDPVKVTNYPDSGDGSTSYLLIEETILDGSRRALTETKSQVPKGAGGATAGQRQLKKEDIVYGPESAVLSRTLTGVGTEGGGDSRDVLTRRFTLDLFGNVYTWQKETRYAGRQDALKHEGPVHIYDEGNRLATVRNQLGQEETSTFDANGWLATLRRHDGSVVTFQSNDVGQLTEETHGAGGSSTSTKLTYDNDGHLHRVTEGDTETMTYDMSLDGTLTKVTYPDGRQQRYVLDKHSRPEEEYDVFGVCRKTTFDASGKIETQSCQGDVVTRRYGTVNHTKGQSIGFHVTGKRTQDITIDHDGFHRARETTAVGKNGAVLLKNTYGFDVTGRTTAIKTRSAASPHLDCERTMAYDGLGQLVRERRSSGGPAETRYTYDGNFNILTKVTDGQRAVLTYNAIDQRTDAGFSYDSNGRLATDDRGNRYTFDDRDRLRSVRTSGDEVASEFGYHADGYLARRTGHGGGGSLALFHTSGRFNAFSHTSGKGQDVKDGIKTSMFSGAPLLMTATYTAVGTGGSSDARARYALTSLSSNVLVMGHDDEAEGESVISSVVYDAYGSPTPSSPSPSEADSDSDVVSDFGFAGEFTDKASGLVYLRSRYYSPRHMAFLSMDRNHQENRYSYCDGDPVNNVDPLGLSWSSFWDKAKKWVGLAVGAVVAIAVTALTAGLAAPLIGALAAGIIGGAIGSIAGGAVNAEITGQRYTWKDALVDGLAGAASGFVGAGLERAGQTVGQSLAKGFGEWTFKGAAKGLGMEGLKGLAANTADAEVRAISRNVLFGEPIDPLQILESMAVGFVGGAAGAVIKPRLSAAWDRLGTQAEKLSTRVRVQAKQYLSRAPPRQLSPTKWDMMVDIMLDLPAFRHAGVSSPARSGALEMAHVSTTPRRVSTDIGAHDEGEGGHHFPLQITML